MLKIKFIREANSLLQEIDDMIQKNKEMTSPKYQRQRLLSSLCHSPVKIETDDKPQTKIYRLVNSKDNYKSDCPKFEYYERIVRSKSNTNASTADNYNKNSSIHNICSNFKIFDINGDTEFKQTGCFKKTEVNEPKLINEKLRMNPNLCQMNHKILQQIPYNTNKSKKEKVLDKITHANINRIAKSPKSIEYIEGKNFFKVARNKLQEEQFNKIIKEIKKFINKRQSANNTLEICKGILGHENKELLYSLKDIISYKL